MAGPAASVVIPSHGGAGRLSTLFDALRHQVFDDEWEIIVVLDGVVDASPEAVESARDLPIRVIEFSENRGRPAALNAGFTAARGEVLIRCDDDLGVAPTFLANHVAAHRGRDPVGVVGLCRDVLAESAYARFYGRPANDRIRDAAYALPPDRWWKYWAANCSVTRATFDRVGLYDEGFRTYGWEDVDWGYRLHLLGVPVVLEPRLEVLHLAASSNVTVRVQRAFLSAQAHARFDRKHGLSQDPVRPHGVSQHVWRLATTLVARRATAPGLERWAGTLDRHLERLPGDIIARSVALLVESAAVAGYRSGPGPA